MCKMWQNLRMMEEAQQPDPVQEIDPLLEGLSAPERHRVLRERALLRTALDKLLAKRPSSNPELTPATFPEWYARRVEILGTDDPLTVTEYLRTTAKLSSAECLSLAAHLEQECLSRIAVLENMQLLLRGEAVTEEEVENPERFTNRVLSVARNKRSPLPDEQTRRRALATLILQLHVIQNISLSYMRHVEQQTPPRVPAVLYAWEPFRPTIEETPFTTVPEYFGGLTDDTGEFVAEPHIAPFLHFPRKAWTAGGVAKAKAKIFPMQPSKKFRDSTHERTSALVLPEDYQGGQVSPHSFPVLNKPQTYVAFLLYVAKILEDMSRPLA